MALNWYIVHVYSGFEGKVKTSLEDRIATSPHKEQFGQIIVPTEQVVELVEGKRRESSRKFYPGYILVQLELNDATWHMVNDTAKVTGFLGGRERPAPVSQAEVDRILNRMEAGKSRPKPKYSFEKGDEVRVVDGPFANFSGMVDEVNPEKGKVKVMVRIFGRSTPVELEFVQVSKT